MERDPKRMFKVIVAGGISLVSVGSLVALGACGSAVSGGMPLEGPPPPPSETPPPPFVTEGGSDAGTDAQEPYEAGDAGDADASFPPIL